MPEHRPKQKHRRPEPREHRMPHLWCFSLEFLKRKTFLKFFWIPPKGLPFVCFDILQHNGYKKIRKGPPFYVFGTVTLVVLEIYPQIANAVNSFYWAFV